MRSSHLFHFLRGALRGSFGDEDLRNHRFLLIGMSQLGQELLGHLCVDGVDIRFQDSSISNYQKSFTVCRDVDVYEGAGVDVIVDLDTRLLILNDRVFPLDKIGDNPYIQGIHEFYL
jgi:hypothetical protein